MDKLDVLDLLLGRWGRAIAVITRLRNRPGRELRAAAEEYDERVEAARKVLAKAEREYGNYDQRTGEARAALDAAAADTGAVDGAWGSPEREPGDQDK